MGAGGSVDVSSELEKPLDGADVNTPRGESARAEVVRLRALLKNAVDASTTASTAATFSVRIAKKSGAFDVTMETPPGAGHEAPEQASGGTWTYVGCAGNGKQWNAWFERAELESALGVTADTSAADAHTALSTRLKPVGASLTIAKEAVPQEDGEAAAPAEEEAAAPAEEEAVAVAVTETLGGDVVATPAAAES